MLVCSLYLRRPDVQADVQMVAVDLSGNNLTGTLPAVWLDLPQVGFASCPCIHMYTESSTTNTNAHALAIAAALPCPAMPCPALPCPERLIVTFNVVHRKATCIEPQANEEK